MTEAQATCETLGYFIRRFSPSDVISTGNTQASMQRKIRSAIQSQFGLSDDELETILPKKVNLTSVRCGFHVQCIVVDTEIRFFQHRSGDFIPHLRILHRFPFMLPKIQCDAGACKFIFSGADVMCPGITSKGGRIFTDLPKGTLVQICIEGKEHAVGIGRLSMSTSDIQSVNKGHGIESIHVLNDGLWKTGRIV